MPEITRTLPAHVLANREIDDNDCWNWTRSLMQDGYAQTTHLGERWQVHRLVYTLMVGPIANGLVVDHLCRNRRCFNPHHLEPVTIPENIRRGVRAKQTHCKRGHEFNEANTYFWRETSEGGRSRKCRACIRERYQQKRNAA